ncbi:MAG: hypothetical protein QOD84_3014 [Acidobacteriaceae bacterium]|jgi:hypothetical protein
MSKSKLRMPLFVLLFLACSIGAAFADSQVRIVRLSTVEGSVQVNRNTGAGYEKAMLNFPITQGVKVRTQSEARAEIEFEDGSTLRLAPDTTVDFPQLSLRDSGSKVSDVNLESGKLYVNFAAAKDDELTLIFGHEKLGLKRAAHLRIETAPDGITVAVFKGDVEVQGPSGTVTVSKNRTAVFDVLNNDHATVAKNLEPDPYDAWDKQQQQYHERYNATASNAYSPYTYGVADLNYYGNFFSAPGYGTLWQPYFASAGWDPFMNGAWAFNSGAGFGWVSSYPWGWTPYHYGSWVFIPAYGWAWQPGGAWVGLNTVPRIVNPPRQFVAPQPPSGGVKTVAVNRGPLPVLSGRSANKLVIRNDSAGLGVPRGGLKNPAKVSQSVAQSGSVATRIHTAPIESPRAQLRTTFEGGRSVSRPSYPVSSSTVGTAPAPRAASPAPSPSGHASGGAVRH